MWVKCFIDELGLNAYPHLLLHGGGGGGGAPRTRKPKNNPIERKNKRVGKMLHRWFWLKCAPGMAAPGGGGGKEGTEKPE